MAFLESGTFCSADEYKSGLPRRVDETQLRIGDLYTFAMKLESEKREAAKLAVRALKLISKAGLTVVSIAFVDIDLNPINSAKAYLVNGLVDEVPGTNVVDPTTNESFAIRQAYFKDYFEEQFGGLLAASDQLIASI
jgi:hypothetical protein